jgi:hypothetical protein
MAAAIRPLIGIAFVVVLAGTAFYFAFAQDPLGRPQLDRTKPVPSKAEVLSAWRKRQDAIRTFRFAWVERQIHPRGWIPNPRFPERERIALPTLRIDREYEVTKTLAVDGDRMRYSLELDRKPEPDGIIVKGAPGDTLGLGEGKHYRYESRFDGQRGRTRLTLLSDSMPPVVLPVASSVDAQNLDTRAILLAFRPLDSVMGDLLVERARTNQMRSFFRGRSRFILEERRDPSGWKTELSIEPERDFLVSRFVVLFEQRWILDLHVDYREDARWGWVPSGWRVSQRLVDGSWRQIAEATVTSYSINEPIDPSEFAADD